LNGGGLVKQLTGHTHTGHTDRENTPDTGTHTRTTRPGGISEGKYRKGNGGEKRGAVWGGDGRLEQFGLEPDT